MLEMRDMGQNFAIPINNAHRLHNTSLPLNKLQYTHSDQLSRTQTVCHDKNVNILFNKFYITVM